MKKLTTLLCLIVVSQLISACSQGRYTHYQQPQRNQHYASVQNHGSQQHRQQQRQRYKRQQGKYYSQQSPAQRQVQNPAPRPTVQYIPQATPYTIHPARNKMVQLATSAIGTPYKWGGDSPQKGFDCSGLMTYVHKHALGIKIPRTTAQQRDRSRSIPYRQLQPGDMLFFKTGSRSNHVGIYIGERKFVHAPSRGKRVTVATMDNAYWHKRFVKFGSFL